MKPSRTDRRVDTDESRHQRGRSSMGCWLRLLLRKKQEGEPGAKTPHPRHTPPTWLCFASLTAILAFRQRHSNSAEPSAAGRGGCCCLAVDAARALATDSTGNFSMCAQGCSTSRAPRHREDVVVQGPGAQAGHPPGGQVLQRTAAGDQRPQSLQQGADGGVAGERPPQGVVPNPARCASKPLLLSPPKVDTRPPLHLSGLVQSVCTETLP